MTGGEGDLQDLWSDRGNAEVVRETRDGRMQEVEIKLSNWVFNAIRSKEVLTLHRDYFRLRKPLERRIYELARKHCGAQKEWRISLALLQKECGSNSTPRVSAPGHEHRPRGSGTRPHAGLCNLL